jgi:hypothetical protein
MKLLRFEAESENTIDQVLMVVPDDYNKSFALDEATDVIGACYVADEAPIEESGLSGDWSKYRIYVG